MVSPESREVSSLLDLASESRYISGREIGARNDVEVLLSTKRTQEETMTRGLHFLVTEIAGKDSKSTLKPPNQREIKERAHKNSSK